MSDVRRTGYLTALIVFAADQALKYLVVERLALPARGQIELLPIFDLTWVKNYGISLGLFTAASESQRWILVGVTAVVALGVAVWLWRERVRSDVIALGMVLGGALGNILDRVRLGYVADFLDLHIGSFRPFLVFNVADAAITIGVLILLLRAFFVRETDAPAEKKNA
jgi:signal peptidase II